MTSSFAYELPSGKTVTVSISFPPLLTMSKADWDAAFALVDAIKAARDARAKETTT